MAYRIISPRFSFVQFDLPADGYCLPVYDVDDVHFQFVVQADSIGEADTLCDLTNNTISIGTRLSCGDALTPFTSKAERYRISELQVLYNWQHGIENLAQIHVGQCFHIGVNIGAQSFCSNCFEKIRGDGLTAVVEYGNDENAFGFNYCGSGIDEVDDAVDCSPTVIQFTNTTNLVIPYTAQLVAKYGVIPSIQIWIYNASGELQNMGVQATFDTYPPTKILIDMGGAASGIVKIL